MLTDSTSFRFECLLDQRLEDGFLCNDALSGILTDLVIIAFVCCYNPMVLSLFWSTPLSNGLSLEVQCHLSS